MSRVLVGAIVLVSVGLFGACSDEDSDRRPSDDVLDVAAGGDSGRASGGAGGQWEPTEAHRAACTDWCELEKVLMMDCLVGRDLVVAGVFTRAEGVGGEPGEVDPTPECLGDCLDWARDIPAECETGFLAMLSCWTEGTWTCSALEDAEGVTQTGWGLLAASPECTQIMSDTSDCGGL